ncbi:hypothetical protein M8O52_11395 [Akkermansia muciniphila]|uniref:hypothetical protein n=1 Tax=Akkermansia muciniphila TaxID=239935 RepID=UPI00201DE723|nr:hypothetical protein [Akkermansia muciniphila]MCL6677631.1 hypothetical protein [Akkermansia muciniphila]
MNDGEIQIQFPKPGNWQEFSMTAIYRDSDGYTRIDRYQQNDVPAEQAPAMAAVVAALVGLGEDWQAVQVWAHLMTATVYNEDDPYTPTGQRDEVALDVEAVNPQAGRRVFTSRDYPAFVITDPAAVDFFKHFTTPNQ